MKNISVLLLTIFLLSSCSFNRYLLTDKGKDSKFLINTIKESSATGEINRKPIIVVDGKPYRYDYELKSGGLQLSKNDVQKLEIVKKEIGMQIYGDQAKDGVILLTTKSGSNTGGKSYNDSKVLIFLEDKVISQSEMETINPDTIDSIEIIKDKETVKQYTSEDYDGVIVIHLKKTN